MAFSLNSLAWVAMAVGDGNTTHISYNNDTREEAALTALKGCRERYTGCGLKNVVNGVAYIVAKGDDGWGSATGGNPKETARRALQNCKEVSRGCKIAQAVWDPGTYWSAVAASDDFFYGVVNQASPAEAEEAALAGCRKGSAGGCVVVPDWTSSARGIMAMATAPSGASGLYRAATKAEASAGALASCKKIATAGEICKIIETRMNESAEPEPASMAAVKAEAARYTAARPSASGPAKTRASTRATNYTSCQNSCVNGACLRTFPDGRKERWQAPRVYNALTSNWEWDITTNACGL